LIAFITKQAAVNYAKVDYPMYHRALMDNPYLTNAAQKLLLEHARKSEDEPYATIANILKHKSTLSSTLDYYALDSPEVVGAHPNTSVKTLVKILENSGLNRARYAALRDEAPIELSVEALFYYFKIEGVALYKVAVKYKNIESRVDAYLRQLGWENETLKAAPLYLKLRAI